MEMVEELSSYTPQDLADLDALMHELSDTSFCNEELLKNALNDANVYGPAREQVPGMRVSGMHIEENFWQVGHRFFGSWATPVVT